MNAKLIKTGESFLLKDVNNETLAITSGTMQGRILSIKNCQAIERGYDLDELASGYSEGKSTAEVFKLAHEADFKAGFQKALELMGDKKFSEGDMLECWNTALQPSNSWSKFMDSLQKTEWDVEVEINEEKEFIFDPTMGISQGHYLDKPKLDENGCLILKKI